MWPRTLFTSPERGRSARREALLRFEARREGVNALPLLSDRHSAPTPTLPLSGEGVRPSRSALSLEGYEASTSPDNVATLRSALPRPFAAAGSRDMFRRGLSDKEGRCGRWRTRRRWPAAV